MLDNGCCGGTFLPRSEEEAWNWVVVRGSAARPADFFWSSPFLRDTMPSRASCYVPEGTNVKKIVQLGRLSEWRCTAGQTTSLWSWWERRMQKRQCCTWGSVFSPVPSEGRTAQGMDCEDLSEKYSHLHKTPVSVVPISMEGNVKILFLSCKICVD